MDSSFKLRSGNSVPFKQMGSTLPQAGDSPLKQWAKGFQLAAKYGPKIAKKVKGLFSKAKPPKPPKPKPTKPNLVPTGTGGTIHPQSGEYVMRSSGNVKTTNPYFIRNQADWLKQTQKYWLGK